MIEYRKHHKVPDETLVNEIRNRLSRCEAASLPMLESDLSADADALLSGLRVLVDAGRVEELDPVAAGQDLAGRCEMRTREHRFYRLLRESDRSYDRVMAVDRMPLNVLARRAHSATVDALDRKGG